MPSASKCAVWDVPSGILNWMRAFMPVSTTPVGAHIGYFYEVWIFSKKKLLDATNIFLFTEITVKQCAFCVIICVFVCYFCGD